jgi:hypothetical protein
MRADWLQPVRWGTIDGGWRELWQYRSEAELIVIEDHASHGSHRDPPLVVDELKAFDIAVIEAVQGIE